MNRSEHAIVVTVVWAGLLAGCGDPAGMSGASSVGAEPRTISPAYAPAINPTWTHRPRAGQEGSLRRESRRPLIVSLGLRTSTGELLAIAASVIHVTVLAVALNRILGVRQPLWS